MSREVHDKFVEIKIHTAKCDNCNKHNTAIIFRCQTCGQQCCTPCWQRNGGDDRHRLNGGDQGFAVAGEMLGKRKRKRTSAIVNEKRRVRSRMAINDDEGDEEKNEDDNGEGYAEVIATSNTKAQIETQGEAAKKSSHRSRKSTETEPPAANSKQLPEKEPSPSILMTADRLLSHAFPSRIHASALSRLRPRLRIGAMAVSHTTATVNTHSSTYISPYAPSASDHDGIMTLLRAIKYIENDKLLSPSPPGASQTLSAPRKDEDEEGDEGWQDAQVRSPLFMPEDIDLNTQSDGGEAEAWRTQGEDMMLQMDGAQDNVAGIDLDEEEASTRRVLNSRLDMEDGYDEETEYEDWPRKIGGAESRSSRATDEARTSRDLNRDFLRATQKGRKVWRSGAPRTQRN